MAGNTTYSIRQAGARLGVGYRRARQLIASGELKASNIAERGEKPIWRVTGSAIAACKKRRAA
jgi:hypothetical protein